MSISEDNARDLLGATLYGAGGEKIGKIGQVFLDDQTGRPEWATVSTGFFGANESFVPLADAGMDGDRVTVGYDKDLVKGAPNVDPEGGHLSEADEQELYTYYGLSRSTVRDGATYNGTDSTESVSYSGTTASSDASTGAGHDTSGPDTDEAMTRSEERLRAGTETVNAGRARLRKYVVTENETVTVPVTREKARLVTEPITDANRDAAYSGGDITEEEHEVTLREERPVVTTETVPVERVRLETETESREETVAGEVRKEHIEFEGDGTIPDVREDRR